ncbi:uracil-DNA glycosylase, family 4 [Oligella ureolytica]|uniref:uracil-DNA glycosylase family protein n=1 Tax=Oligella ureolytica TaxID=90244 RepID=UPI000E0389F0|nr:hypothetical protein [Oligella ureolytica]SUA58983.1 uracil-DNA glycosylase, family 4 [Oligella ureolytica]
MTSELSLSTAYVDLLNPIQRQMLTELGVDFLWGESLAPTLQKTVKASAAPVKGSEVATDDSLKTAASSETYQQQPSIQPQAPVTMATPEVASANAAMARKMLQRAKHRIPAVAAPAELAPTAQNVVTPSQASSAMSATQETNSSSNELSTLSWQSLAEMAATQELELPMEQRVVSVLEDKSEGRQVDWLFIDQLYYLDAERYGFNKAKQVRTLFSQMLLALGLEQSDIAILPLLTSQQATHRAIFLEQIKRLQPKCIVAFGDAAASLLQEDKGLLALMSQTQYFQHPELGQIPLVTIFSPYYLLANGSAKAQTWQGLKRARKIIRERA